MNDQTSAAPWYERLFSGDGLLSRNGPGGVFGPLNEYLSPTAPVAGYPDVDPAAVGQSRQTLLGSLGAMLYGASMPGIGQGQRAQILAQAPQAFAAAQRPIGDAADARYRRSMVERNAAATEKDNLEIKRVRGLMQGGGGFITSDAPPDAPTGAPAAPAPAPSAVPAAPTPGPLAALPATGGVRADNAAAAAERDAVLSRTDLTPEQQQQQLAAISSRRAQQAQGLPPGASYRGPGPASPAGDWDAGIPPATGRVNTQVAGATNVPVGPVLSDSGPIPAAVPGTVPASFQGTPQPAPPGSAPLPQTGATPPGLRPWTASRADIEAATQAEINRAGTGQIYLNQRREQFHAEQYRAMAERRAAEDQARQGRTEERVAATGARTAANEAERLELERRRFALQQSAATTQAAQGRTELEAKLNQRHDEHKETAMFREVQGSVRNLRYLLTEKGDAAADAPIVTEFARLFQPGLNVTDQEAKSNRRTAGISDQLWADVEKAVAGKSGLAGVTRRSLLEIIDRHYEHWVDRHDQRLDGARGLARDLGVRPEVVARDEVRPEMRGVVVESRRTREETARQRAEAAQAEQQRQAAAAERQQAEQAQRQAAETERNRAVQSIPAQQIATADARTLAGMAADRARMTPEQQAALVAAVRRIDPAGLDVDGLLSAAPLLDMASPAAKRAFGQRLGQVLPAEAINGLDHDGIVRLAPLAPHLAGSQQRAVRERVGALAPVNGPGQIEDMGAADLARIAPLSPWMSGVQRREYERRERHLLGTATEDDK